MKYDLRNEHYVLEFCEANNINESTDIKTEVKALKKFLSQFDDTSIAIILEECFGDEPDEDDDCLSMEELIDAICDIYVSDKEETADTEFKFFLDDIVTFIVDEGLNYGIDCPDEFLD